MTPERAFVVLKECSYRDGVYADEKDGRIHVSGIFDASELEALAYYLRHPDEVKAAHASAMEVQRG
jgi:hypothetical protein